LKNDFKNLAAHFVTCGYIEENGVFCMALENNEGKTIDVTSENYYFVECQLGANKCCI